MFHVSLVLSQRKRLAMSVVLITMDPFWLYAISYITAPNILGVPKWDPSFGNYPYCDEEKNIPFV